MKSIRTSPSSRSEPSEDRLNMLSHELRTPLAIISGYAEMLDEEAGADLNHLTQPIRDAISRMEHVVDSLIDYEQAKNAPPRRQTAPRVEGSRIPLDHLIGRMVQKVQHRHPDSDVSILMQVTETVSLPTDVADAMGSALNHVLDNAVKFADQTVRVATRYDGAQLQIAITDDGPGLPSTSVAVFAPFQQGSSGLSREQSGLGMGLYLAKQSLGQVSGSIKLQSNASSKGATAIINVSVAATPSVRRAA